MWRGATEILAATQEQQTGDWQSVYTTFVVVKAVARQLNLQKLLV